MLDLLREYNAGMAKLKQFDPQENGEGFDYNNPDELIEALGMTPEQEVMLTTVLTNELKEDRAKAKRIPVYQLELRMSHVKDVKVNYDYLTELIEKLLNQVHEKKETEAEATEGEIRQFANGLDDRSYARRIIKAAQAIRSGLYPPDGTNLTYPVKLDDSEAIIIEANKVTLDRLFLDFRNAWGITDVIKNAQLHELLSRHQYGQLDLDDTGQIKNLIAEASNDYKNMATDEGVRALSRIKYRNGLREAIYELFDDLAME